VAFDLDTDAPPATELEVGRDRLAALDRIPEPNGAGLPDAVGARDEVHLLDEPVEPVVEADAVEQASLDDPRAVDEPRPGDEVLAHHVHAVVEAEMAAGAVELELADRRAELDT